jgi:glyoxylase-like metal-dependent hydrolase (beta-lactamase superfamily II)
MRSPHVTLAYPGRLGLMDYVVASDGSLDVGSRRDVLKPLSDDFTEIDDADGRLELAQNALALRSAGGWIVFETGAGSIVVHANAGRLPANLDHVGIDRERVVALVPTHAHLDHVGGIMNPSGRSNYSNAAIHLAGVELDFWLHDNRLLGRTANSAAVARKNLVPNLDRLVCHHGNVEILPGIHAVPTPGHTIGHSSFVISDGNDQLFIAGDLAHHISQIRDPAIATAFDFDPALGVATRWKMLDFLASTHMLTLFYHFPWPGLGHIERCRLGYYFLPITG